jgi:hypothetical protein
MAAIKQRFQINERIAAYLKFIDAKLGEQAFADAYTYRSKNYNVSGIVSTALTRWARKIGEGDEIALDKLEAYLIEYLYLAYVNKGNTTQIYINEITSNSFDVIATYLLDYPDDVPLLEHKGKKKVNRHLIIILALLKLSEDLGHKIPNLLPPKP